MLVGAHIVICMFVSGTSVLVLSYSVLVGASIVISAVISKLFTLALCISIDTLPCSEPLCL